jgi:hypothetical protein
MVATAAPAVCCGYLEKRAHAWGVGWQRRYFEAAGNYLRYYKDDTKAALSAVINLGQVQVVSAPDFESSCTFYLLPISCAPDDKAAIDNAATTVLRTCVVDADRCVRAVEWVDSLKKLAESAIAQED